MNQMYRDHTKVIHIGDRVIGGGNPILIQSMTNTKTEDVAATVAQIRKLTAAGCDIIRCAVPTKEADIGIAGGVGEGLLIKKGEVVRKVPEAELLSVLREELLHWNDEK